MMSGFFWGFGHLGWGVFSLAVFTCLWWLLVDVAWRTSKMRISAFLMKMAAGWMVGAGLILASFCLFNAWLSLAAG